jgi:hypothetical protein
MSAGPWSRGGAALLSSVLVAGALAAAPAGAAAPARRESPGAAAVVPPSRLAGRAVASGGDGSIVFVRDADVFVVRPDGSGERRLTSGGSADAPWSSPSEDDAGHVVAAHGAGDATKLVRMDQHGRVLSSFAPPVRSLAVGFARVSPDGGRIAYGSMFGETNCGYTPCHTFFDHAVNYTRATSSAAVSTAQEDAEFASWASDGRTVLGTVVHNEVRYHDVAATSSQVWFDDCLDYEDGCNDTNLYHYWPTVSRQGDRYASVLEVAPWSGDPQEYLLLQPVEDATGGTPPGEPHDGCVVGPYPLSTPDPGPDDHLVAMPSWSPDGRSVVVALRDPSSGWSVYRVEAPDLADCSTVTGVELVAGAGQPFWSPADLTAGDGDGSGDGTTRLSYDGPRPAILGRPRVGHRVRLSLSPARLAAGFSPAATTVRLAWLRDGRPIPGATGRSYRPKAGDRHHRLSVRVTGRRADAAPGTVRTRAVRVR